MSFAGVVIVTAPKGTRYVLVTLLFVGGTANLATGGTVAGFSDSHAGVGNVTAASDFGGDGGGGSPWDGNAGGPYSVDEGGTVQVESDLTCGILWVQCDWSKVSGVGELSNTEGRTADYTAPADVDGDQQVIVKLTRDSALTGVSSDTATITVRDTDGSGDGSASSQQMVQSTQTSTPTATETPTPEPTETSTPNPNTTSSETATLTPTATPTPTSTPTETTATVTPTQTQTATTGSDDTTTNTSSTATATATP